MIKNVNFVSEKDFSELYEKFPKKIKLDLKNVRRAFVYLDLQERLAPCILVAGTNGKGSTAGLLWHLFATCDLQAGLFTSPHILDAINLKQYFRISSSGNISLKN